MRRGGHTTMVYTAPSMMVVVMLAASATELTQTSLDIALKHDSAGEAQTRDQLRKLVAAYDVSPWIYTRSVVIDERAVPFSHPVLTLHTRHAKDDELLLSTFIHEQLHWFFAERTDATDLAIGDLRRVFPAVPVGGSIGARDERSTYLHLLVCYLEQQADIHLLGELKAKQVMEFWASDHYSWVYETVLDRGRDIRKILDDRKLMPAR